MKIVAFIIIAGVAAIIGWFAFTPQCPGGAVATGEVECQQILGFDRAFCQMAFARQEDAIRRAGNVFATQQDCNQRHITCIPFPGLHSWTPKPTGFCLVKSKDGALARMEPVYGRQ